MTVENTTNRTRIPSPNETMGASQSFQTAKGKMQEKMQNPSENPEGPSEEARIAELTQPRGLEAGQILGKGDNNGVTTAEQRAELRKIRTHPSNSKNELAPLEDLSRTTEVFSKERTALDLEGNPTSTGETTISASEGLKYSSKRVKYSETRMKYT